MNPHQSDIQVLMQQGRRSHAQYRSAFLLFALVALIGFGMSACDDSVNPIVSSNQQITLFATLDMNADVQYVRFIPIRGTIGMVAENTEDYALRSTDLTSGEVLDWADSLHTFSNGSVGLFFYANLRVRPGHTYSFEATKAGSDIVTTAITTLPSTPEYKVDPESVRRFVGGTGFIVEGSQSVSWKGLNADPFSVRIWYRFLRTRNEPFRDIELSSIPFMNYAAGDLSFNLNLTADRILLADSIDLAKNALMGIGMEITSLDDDFAPPGGLFDPEVLVQPGTFSNVTNGFGFIGSVARFRAEWTLSDESMRILRYQTPIDLFGKTDMDQASGTWYQTIIPDLSNAHVSSTP